MGDDLQPKCNPAARWPCKDVRSWSPGGVRGEEHPTPWERTYVLPGSITASEVVARAALAEPEMKSPGRNKV